MVEIFALIFMVRTLRSMLAAKGQSAWWAALGPVLWISGEISGAILGVIVDPEVGVTTIACALGGAIGGGALAFLVVSLLPREAVDEVTDLGGSRGDVRFDGSPWQAPR